MTTTPNYQFYLPADNEPGWGESFRAFIRTVDRDLFTSKTLTTQVPAILQRAAEGRNTLALHLQQSKGAHAASAITETGGHQNVQAALDALRVSLSALERTVEFLETKANDVVTVKGSATQVGSTPQFRFTVDASSSVGSPIIARSIRFGDGATYQLASGESVVLHTYTTSGVFRPTVEAMDALGTKGSSDFAVDVAGIISANLAVTPAPGLPAIFRFTPSFGITLGSITSATLDFGDGMTVSALNLPSIDHGYKQTPFDQTFTAKLTVTPSHGNPKTVSQVVNVPAQRSELTAPTLDVRLTDRPREAQLVKAGYQTAPADLNITLSLDWGDGSPAVPLQGSWVNYSGMTTDVVPTHTYAPGTYHLRLTATDQYGRTASGHLDLIVNDTATGTETSPTLSPTPTSDNIFHVGYSVLEFANEQYDPNYYPFVTPESNPPSPDGYNAEAWCQHTNSFVPTPTLNTVYLKRSISFTKDPDTGKVTRFEHATGFVWMLNPASAPYRAAMDTINRVAGSDPMMKVTFTLDFQDPETLPAQLSVQSSVRMPMSASLNDIITALTFDEIGVVTQEANGVVVAPDTYRAASRHILSYNVRFSHLAKINYVDLGDYVGEAHLADIHVEMIG